MLYMPVIQGIRTPADNPRGLQSPADQGMPFTEHYIPVPGSDGLLIHGWFIPAEEHDFCPSYRFVFSFFAFPLLAAYCFFHLCFCGRKTLPLLQLFYFVTRMQATSAFVSTNFIVSSAFSRYLMSMYNLKVYRNDFLYITK